MSTPTLTTSAFQPTRVPPVCAPCVCPLCPPVCVPCVCPPQAKEVQLDADRASWEAMRSAGGATGEGYREGQGHWVVEIM